MNHYFISWKTHPTFTGDTIIYKVIAFICCGKCQFALPTMLQHYQETLININQQCSRVTNYLPPSQAA